MTASAKIEVDFVAQTAAFNANITKAAAHLNSNAAKMNRSLEAISSGFALLKGAAIVGVLFEVGKQLAEVAARSLEYAGSLGEAAQQLGVNSAELQIYRQVAAQAGIEQATLDKGLQKLTRSLGDASVGAAAPLAAFKALGISVRDSNGVVKTAGEVIPEITKKFDAITSPAQRAALEVALFGKAGQELDTLLAGGSAEVDGLKKHLEELGVVLSEDEIRNADKAADKIGEVKWVLEQSIAKTVSENAASIFDLANSIENLVVKLPNAIDGLKRFFYELQSTAGMIQSVAGLSQGAKKRGMELQVDAQNNIGIIDARGKVRDMLGGLKPGDRKTANNLIKKFWPEDLQKAMGVWVPDGPTRPPGGLNVGNFKGSPSPKTAAKPVLEEYQQQLAQLNTQLLQATRANLSSVDAQYQNDLLIAKSEEAQVEANLRKKAVTNKIVAAHLGELLGIAQSVEAQKEITLKNQMLDQQSKDAVEILAAANDNARDLLQAQEQTVRTAADRRTIELQLLELDTTNQRLKLQQIIDSTTAKDQEKKLAKQALEALGDLVDARRDAVMKATEGPLGQYVNSLPQGQGDVMERQQQVIVDKANELINRTHEFADSFASSINSGVQDLLQGKSIMESLKDVVGGLAQTFQKAFILDPLQDFVRNKISGPLSEKLFHTNAGQQGLSQADTNKALAAAAEVGVAKLTNFSTAVDAAAMALARLSTGSVSVEGFAAGVMPAPASANYDGVIMDNPFASASEDVAGLGASAQSVTKSLNAQVPALAQFGSSLLSMLGGNVSGGGSGFLKGLLSIGTMVAGSIGGHGMKVFGGHGGSMAGAAFHPGGFAEGGRPPLGVPSWIGERGKELFVPDVPGTIIPHGASMALSRAANNNDRPAMGPVHFHFPNVTNERDARIAGRQASAAFQRELSKTSKQGY
jgi:hypothetical protein